MASEHEYDDDRCRCHMNAPCRVCEDACDQDASNGGPAVRDLVRIMEATDE